MSSMVRATSENYVALSMSKYFRMLRIYHGFLALPVAYYLK
jgi:hypothetical protein